jgi:phosphoglycolate phosphatase
MKVGFDLDGVLLDSESDRSWLDRALDSALAALDLPVTEENRRRLYPASVHDFAESTAELPVDTDHLWHVRTRHYTETKVEAIRTGELEPFADVRAIERLTDRTCFLVSNSPQEVVDAFVETTEYDDLFAATVGRGQARADLADLKPAPAFYERVAEQLGDGEYVYVGDKASDREFAANTGMEYVHLDRSERSLDEVVDHIEAGEFERF